MKKTLLLPALILSMILISGCRSSENSGEAPTRLISIDSNIYNNGELFIDNQQRLNFFDFTSMKSAIICPKPNCPHNEQSGCPSFGMTTCPLIYNDHLYFFDYETQYGKDGSPVWITNMYRASIDGTNRIKINSFENYRLMYYDRLILCDDTLYFAPLVVSYDENGTESNLLGAKLCSYSFSDNEVRELCDLGEGYGLNAYLWGEAGGDIYIDVSYREEYIPYDELMDILATGEEDISVRKNYKYSVGGNLLSECDPNYKPMLGGYLCRFEDNGVTLYLSGRELFVSDITTDIYDIYSFMASGGYVFDLKDSLAIDIISGKKYALSADGSDFIYYTDGYYILKRLNYDTGVYEYEKVSEADIIGDEIE